MPAQNHEPSNRLKYLKETSYQPAYFNDSVGKTLQRRRQELGLSLEDITKETKIQRRYLIAIEAGNWKKIPHTVHALGFVRKYAVTLGLDDGVAATKYLLERGPLIEGPNPTTRTKIKRTVIGSRVLIGTVIAGAILVIVGYLILQISILAAPPNLTVSNPAQDQQIQSTSIEIKGHTTPSASVFVNTTPVVVDDEGNFYTSINLNEGLNTIVIEAKNQAGKQSSVERTIIVAP